MNFAENLEHFCPDGNVTITNGVPVCNCGEQFSLENDNTCKLKSLCDEDQHGRLECSKKNAMCLLDTKVGKFNCQCPIGKIFPDMDLNPKDGYDKNSCIDLCSLSGKEHRCSEINGKCNPGKLLQQLTKGIHRPDFDQYCDCSPGSFMDPVRGCVLARFSASIRIIFKNTFQLHEQNPRSIDLVVPFYFRSEAAHSSRKKRAANDELKMHDPIKIDETVYKIDPIGFYEAYQRQFKLNEDLEKQHNSTILKYELKNYLITRAYEILAHTEIIESNKSIEIETCDYKNSDEYDCKIILKLNKPYEEYSQNFEKLKTECLKINNAKFQDFCFYPSNKVVINKKDSFDNTPYYSNFKVSIQISLNFGNFLKVNNTYIYRIHIIKTLNLFQPCQNEKSCPEFSNCIPGENNTNYYSCQCDTEMFDRISFNYINTTDSIFDYTFERCRGNLSIT